MPCSGEGTGRCCIAGRNGDYFGRTVNIAARITDHARPGEVLVSDQVVVDTDAVEAVRLVPVGPVALKRRLRIS